MRGAPAVAVSIIQDDAAVVAYLGIIAEIVVLRAEVDFYDVDAEEAAAVNLHAGADKIRAT